MCHAELLLVATHSRDVFWSRFVEQGFGQILEEREMKIAWCIQVQSFVFLQEKVLLSLKNIAPEQWWLNTSLHFFWHDARNSRLPVTLLVGCKNVPCFPPHQPASSISQRREVSLRVT